ncbi:MAG: hypothetical protein WD227_15615 [Vicinamibacterales bacterium]
MLIVSGCGSTADIPQESNADVAVSGSLRSITRIGHHPALKNRALFWWTGLSKTLPVSESVTLYRVEYWTTGLDAERTVASGLVALPGSPISRGVVSYQHPTRTARTNVPSTPSETALVAAIAFAGHGYLFVAPDYLGLGTSPGFHPYLHASSEASAVIDLLKAARLLGRHMGREWPEALFLTGFSQGGHASLAAQRALEENPVEGLRVTASAPIAGAYNLSRIQFPFALEGHADSHTAYLGYVTSAYARIQREPLTSVIADAYVGKVSALLDGSKSLGDVAAALPRDPTELFQPEFIRAFRQGEDTWLARALALNDVFDWVPQAPIRFYYGTADLDAPASDTLFTVEHMRKGGGKVESVNVGGQNHTQVAFSAIPQVRRWFDEVLQQADGFRGVR